MINFIMGLPKLVWYVLGTILIIFLGYHYGYSIYEKWHQDKLDAQKAAYEEQLKKQQKIIEDSNKVILSSNKIIAEKASQVGSLTEKAKAAETRANQAEKDKAIAIAQADALRNDLLRITTEVSNVPDSELRKKVRSSLARLGYIITNPSPSPGTNTIPIPNFNTKANPKPGN